MRFLDISETISIQGQTVPLNVRGMASVGVEISGSFTGTFVFEYSIDGTTWHPITDLRFSQYQVTYGGPFFFNIAGVAEFRVRNSVLNSGTPIVTIHANEIHFAHNQHVTPNIFKTIQANASGNTAVWTPSSGKKFRLTDLFIDVTEDVTLSVAGVLTVKMQDGTTDMNIAFDIYCPSSSSPNAGSAFSTPQLEFVNGILSANTNNVLNVNLSSALAAGKVRVNAWGTEE